MKFMFLTLALFAANLFASPVDEQASLVSESDFGIFAHAFPVEGKDGQAKLFVYSKDELDLVRVKIADEFVLSPAVPVAGGAMFAYRFPGEVAVDSLGAISVKGFEVASLARFEATVELKQDSSPLKYEQSSIIHHDKEAALQAVLVETSEGSNKYHVDLVSLHDLSDVRIWNGSQWTDAQVFPRTNKIRRVYRAAHTVDNNVGLNVDVKAKVDSDGTGFSDKYVLTETEDSTEFKLHTHTIRNQEEVAKDEAEHAAYLQALATYQQELARKEAEKQRIFQQQMQQQQHDNSYQGIAQQRADAMARNCLMPSNHAIAGAPSYPPGVFEGIGMGGPGCATCVGPGNVIADASAVGSDGRTYRVRFYR